MRIQPKVQHQEANLKFWRTVAICLAVLLGATLPLLGGTLRSLPTITRTTGPDIVAHSDGKEAQEPVRVFFGVLSASKNRAARDAIREGWGSTAAIHKLLFVLRAEVTEQQDTLLLPLVIDDYKNITHLTLEICRVASADRSVTHVFKTDDDSFVKVDEVIQELEQAPRQLMQWGHYCEGDPMNRDPNSKHYEDPETWPNGKSPKYCRGMGYALSIDLAREVAAGAALKVPRWQRILDQPLEDRAMGLWLEFIEKDRGVQISRVQAKDRLSEYGCKDDAFVSHHVTPDTLRCTWLSGGRCCDKVDHVTVPEKKEPTEKHNAEWVQRHKTSVFDVEVNFNEKLDKELNVKLATTSAAHAFKQCQVTDVTEVTEANGTAVRPTPTNLDAILHTGSKSALMAADVGSIPCTKESVPSCCTGKFFFRSQTTDVLVFRQVFVDHSLKFLYALFDNKPPNFVLDAGANVGYSTALFKLLWPQATVVSMEPESTNYQVLLRNTERFAKVHHLQAGLWKQKANITVTWNEMGEWANVFREADEGEEGMPAYNVNDVAKMLDIPGFDFLKIDIEGAEGSVFDPEADLSWISNAKLISLEVHDRYAHQFGLEAVSGRVAHALANYDFRVVADNEHLFFINPSLLQ